MSKSLVLARERKAELWGSELECNLSALEEASDIFSYPELTASLFGISDKLI